MSVQCSPQSQRSMSGHGCYAVIDEQVMECAGDSIELPKLVSLTRCRLVCVGPTMEPVRSSLVWNFVDTTLGSTAKLSIITQLS